MDTERLWMEIALRDLTAQGKDAIIRTVKEIQASMAEAEKASGPSAATLASAEKFGKTLGDVAKTAAGVFTGIKLADVAKDFADFHKTTMDGVAGLVPLADRLSITTDELQALQGAARRANVTNEELNKTVATFNKNVGDAGQGNKVAIETFDKLGIKILDSQGQLRPMPDLLMETSRALLAVENGSTRASLGSALLGEKGARLIPLLRELGVPIGDLVERGKSFGEIVDKEIAEKLNKSKDASEAAKQQLTALYATVAAPIEAKALDIIAEKTAAIVRGLKTSREESDKLFYAMQARDWNQVLGAMATGKVQDLSQNQSDALDREKLAKRLADAENWLSRAPKGDRFIGMRQNEVDAARRELEAYDRLTAARRKAVEIPAMDDNLRNGGLPAQDAPKTAGTSNPVVPGSRAGGSNRDRIGEAVNQLKGEVEAAQAAYDALGAGTKTPLEDLQREVDLRKKIADELAKLGKYDPKDPRVAQIKDLVKAHEELETKIKTREAAMRDAVEIERRMGDGTAFLTAETKRLNEARETDRLSVVAYTVAMKEATDKAEDMGRKARGAMGGVDGLLAGMEQAAADWKRSNSEFETGKRLMNDGFNLVKSTVNDWATTGVLDINKFGQAMLQMIANVGIALAQSELMKLFGLGKGQSGGSIIDLFGGSGSGGGGGGIGGFFSGLFSSGGGGGDAWSGLSASWGFAEGGNYPAGQPRIVGEKGWELDIPNTSGTILNQRQLARLLGTSGPEDRQLAIMDTSPVINMPMTVQVGSVVSRAEMERQLALVEQRARQGAIAGMIEARRTSASMRKTFR
ncbi:hypothetical protein [Reyranella sp.]|uniref:hypothetical protein n=1 Tax=Reyranella sp. TaxID=1929291 RepID=UPI003C7BDD5D